jgi:hypothetical protein
VGHPGPLRWPLPDLRDEVVKLGVREHLQLPEREPHELEPVEGLAIELELGEGLAIRGYLREVRLCTGMSAGRWSGIATRAMAGPLLGRTAILAPPSSGGRYSRLNAEMPIASLPCDSGASGIGGGWDTGLAPATLEVLPSSPRGP